MQNEKNQLSTAEIAPHRGQPPAPEARKRGLWNRLPVAAKTILTLPVVMALLGAEVELRLAPQLDLVLTVAGVCAMWAWLSGGPSGVT
ncbi:MULTISPECIES: hypothetical protein [unclassified Acidocella]|uniref:hypothetical protein n=1 Tax=unclassified Acidocella TaxID=2648610 RepID=UPI00028EBD7C|nr:MULTISPECIES: hypothetical protein [unclassified Acidocella]EKM99391.1 hypothetical protein MXAZACID_10638 [Acidocella sp. MX-AZ02]WBO58040.1 hypothetical protein GT370_12290 [Acidocella sp. MX-AZ03]